MIKLGASDIDGTLVPEGTTSINPEFYEIIRKLKEKGILFVGASGRQYSSMRALLDPVFDDIIFISGNGTNIMQKGEKLYSMGMNQADVARLIAYMRTLPDCIFTAAKISSAAPFPQRIKSAGIPSFSESIARRERHSTSG